MRPPTNREGTMQPRMEALEPRVLLSGHGLSAMPEIVKACYSYANEMEAADLDLLKAHGINSFSIKGSYSNNADYSGYPDHLPDGVKDFAALAKAKDMLFFQALNFSHYHFAGGTNTSIVTDNYMVYQDGTASGHVSPWDPVYWQHLTNLVVALAELNVHDPDTYRIDGVMFDFELYNGGGESTVFQITWGYEDPTFHAYLVDRGLTGWNDPPTDPGQRAERYPWLQTHGLLEDYYAFLSETIEGYAEDMKAAVRAVDADFVVGAYMHPVYAYQPEIFDGWSDPYDPTIVWSSEMYWGGGASQIPEGLPENLLPEGYYELGSIYGQEIYGYYVGGMINYEYSPINWAYHIYDVCTHASGYWIYANTGFTEPYEQMREVFRVPLYDEANGRLVDANNATEYAAAVQAYFDQMDLADAELAQWLADPDYQTTLTLVDPEPPRFKNPQIPDALSDETLYPAATVSDYALSVIAYQLRFREQHNFIAWAPAGKTVILLIHSLTVGSTGANKGLTWKVLDPSGDDVSMDYLNPNASGAVHFTAAETGYYTILINPQRGSFYFSQINAPVAIWTGQTDETIHLIYWEGRLSFWVGGEVSAFTVDFRGGGLPEGLTATICRPLPGGGYEAVCSGGTTATDNDFSITVPVAPGGNGDIWQVWISEPDHGGEFCLLEDVYITFHDEIDPYSGLADHPSYFLTTRKPPGDCNGDGSVNVGDLGILGVNYGRDDAGPPDWAGGADLNGDGNVNVGDLGILGANYGTDVFNSGGGSGQAGGSALPRPPGGWAADAPLGFATADVDPASGVQLADANPAPPAIPSTTRADLLGGLKPATSSGIVAARPTVILADPFCRRPSAGQTPLDDLFSLRLDGRTGRGASWPRQ